MNKFRYLIALILIIIITVSVVFHHRRQQESITVASASRENSQQSQIENNPLSIQAMRKKSYPGSDLTIEETLSPGSNYNQYIASYKSDNLTIYGLLTVPIEENPPAGGWPIIIFNHGYIPPDQYQTTERYVAYVDTFARNGYIVFKPDYRGHGNSEGRPEGAYYSPAYTVDVLNAVSSLKQYKNANPNKIGMWGHSLGGNLTLRAMVTAKDIKTGVIWAGAVGTYEELMTQWHGRRSWQPSTKETQEHVTSIRQNLVEKYGSPQQNPGFWQVIDPRFYLADISGPVQLHQGLADEEVPTLFSESLYNDLKNIGKTVQYYTYPEGDHNLSTPNFELAMQRSLDFFNKYLRGGE